MFEALLKAGVSRDKLDGIPTRDMWQIYKDKVKNARRIDKGGERPLPTAHPANPFGDFSFDPANSSRLK